MEKKTIKSNEVYEGSMCAVTIENCNNYPRRDVVYIGDSLCIKVDDRLYYDINRETFLPQITFEDGLSGYKEGLYILSPTLNNKKSMYIFSQDENGYALKEVKKPAKIRRRK